MIDAIWLDRWQLMVKPQADWQDSGNGVLYSALYYALETLAVGASDHESLHMWDTAIEACMPTPGLLQRTPVPGEYGDDSHDNLLGLALGEALFNRAHNNDSSGYCRLVIEYGVAHRFFFDTDGKPELEDFMGRFPAHFMLIHELAYPTRSPLILGALEMAAGLMRPTQSDPGAWHLAWAFHYACKLVGCDVPYFDELTKGLPTTTRAYFQAGHPIIAMADRVSAKA